MIKIRNLREMDAEFKMGPMDVYVGRFNSGRNLKASPLANPFRNSDESQREFVISEYRKWLWGKMQQYCFSAEWDELMRIKRLSEQGEVTLWCWCAPKPCHGDIVRNAVEWMKGGSS